MLGWIWLLYHIDGDVLDGEKSKNDYEKLLFNKSMALHLL